jgi:uncharacterized protein YbjT (DUF2867 family)
LKIDPLPLVSARVNGGDNQFVAAHLDAVQTPRHLQPQPHHDRSAVLVSRDAAAARSCRRDLSHTNRASELYFGVAFDVLKVVSDPAGGVFSRGASVFVSSRVLHYARALFSLAFEPIEGSPVIDKGGQTMKIVVIGGTGLIGSKTVAILRQGDHEVVAASPKSGINTITGEGLKEAMAGAQVVIDLANSPSFEDKAVLEFFETSGRNLLAAEAAAGVRHHVALSIVGTDRTDNGYFRAKVAQEKLIETSGIPYTIIRSTQFLEFLGAIAASSADGNMVRLSPGLFQPIAADDVAAIVVDVALAAPRSGIVEIAGPERAPFNEIVARYLKAVGDPREVVSDPEARYFGGRIEEHSLVPLGEAHLGRISFDEWLRRAQAAA